MQLDTKSGSSETSSQSLAVSLVPHAVYQEWQSQNKSLGCQCFEAVAAFSSSSFVALICLFTAVFLERLSCKGAQQPRPLVPFQHTQERHQEGSLHFILNIYNVIQCLHCTSTYNAYTLYLHIHLQILQSVHRSPQSALAPFGPWFRRILFTFYSSSNETKCSSGWWRPLLLCRPCDFAGCSAPHQKRGRL